MSALGRFAAASADILFRADSSDFLPLFSTIVRATNELTLECEEQ